MITPEQVLDFVFSWFPTIIIVAALTGMVVSIVIGIFRDSGD